MPNIFYIIVPSQEKEGKKMIENDNSFSQVKVISANDVQTKIAKVKETKKVIRQVEKLEIDLTQLRRQISSKETKLSELLKTINL